MRNKSRMNYRSTTVEFPSEMYDALKAGGRSITSQVQDSVRLWQLLRARCAEALDVPLTLSDGTTSTLRSMLAQPDGCAREVRRAGSDANRLWHDHPLAVNLLLGMDAADLSPLTD